jgi:nucleotide-binding universal stress UspA family protein
MDRPTALVLLDHGPACATRTRVAMHLARERGWHLLGLAPTGVIDLPSTVRPHPPLAAYAARAWDALRDQAEAATQRFHDECQVAGVESFEAVIDEAEPGRSLVHHAHCADVVMLTQANADSSVAREEMAVVERVVLDSARPTLLLPRTGRLDHLGRRVLIAWDDSREAARAVLDALPILAHADRVELVSWRERGVPEDKALRAGQEAVHRWLRRHGVACHVYVETPHGRLVDAMLARARQIDADLVVMGAYGHARWAEHVLGGATRDMLSSMTIPVLMSH